MVLTQFEVKSRCWSKNNDQETHEMISDDVFNRNNCARTQMVSNGYYGYAPIPPEPPKQNNEMSCEQNQIQAAQPMEFSSSYEYRQPVLQRKRALDSIESNQYSKKMRQDGKFA